MSNHTRPHASGLPLADTAFIGFADPNDPARIIGVAVNQQGAPHHTGRVLFRQIREYFHGDLASLRTYLLRLHTQGFRNLGETAADNVCWCHNPYARPPARPLLDAAHAALDNEPHMWLYVIGDDALHIRWNLSYQGGSVAWDHTPSSWERGDWLEIGNAMKNQPLKPWIHGLLNRVGIAEPDHAVMGVRRSRLEDLLRDR